MITQLKEIVMNRFKCAEGYNTTPRAFLSNKEIECEGIVVSHVNHWNRIVIKLVQRYIFSNANFNNPKFAVVWFTVLYAIYTLKYYFGVVKLMVVI